MQINSINPTTNFGIHFTTRADKAIKNGINEYRNTLDSRPLSSLYSDMKKSDADCKFDIDDEGYIVVTFNLKEKLNRTGRDANNQESINFSLLKNIANYIETRINAFSKV